jgi:hypothetical protein
MPQPVKLVGGQTSIVSGVEQAVDPLYGAARTVNRPLDYTWPQGIVLGHYRAVGFTSAIAPAANSNLAAFRWTDVSRLGVLTRISASIAVVTAVTAQRVDPLAAFIVRVYTARDVTNATSVAFTASKSQTMRTSMGSSIVGNIDVSNLAAGLTGGTKLVDTNPIGHLGLSGTAAIVGLGTGVFKGDIFKADIANGEHPIVLASNEGVLIQWGATALATGTVIATIEFVWAELPVF